MKKRSNNDSFFIVGLGASAGGLEALEEFFKAMPVESGLAFVVVVHLDPNHVSLMPELLQRQTALSVVQVTDNLPVEPNKIYIIPPNQRLAIIDKRLRLTKLDLPRASHLPIDHFFCSLAQDLGNKAIGVILSGTGSDGSQGLREIKAEAGLVIAQEESSAKYNGMPNSAFNTGLVDYVLAPCEMPAKILQYCQYPHIVKPSTARQAITDTSLPKILAMIRHQVGHDFSQYKTNTLYRRIERRMQLHQIEKIPDYLTFLKKNNHEVAALAKELLIGVTSFFRDPEAFEILGAKYLPELLAQKSNNDILRIWVPGCSSGEEAYSIAMVVQECLDEINQHLQVRIFGSDIDETAIEAARLGFYPANISAAVSDARLKRFFIKEEAGYRIQKSIREMLVFALQNITKDPPFTKLDLISCRNLLIYFSAELQQKILPLFHYSLKSSGLLFLGSSETTGQSNEFFTVLDKKWKLFRRSQSIDASSQLLSRQESLDDLPNDNSYASTLIRKAEDINLLQIVEAILRRCSIPPCVIIDAQQNILYVQGKLGKYLEPAQGKITTNIGEMIHEGLKANLMVGIRKAKQSKITVQKQPITLQTENGPLTVAITVMPILEHSTMQGLLMVVFEEIRPLVSPEPIPPTKLPSSITAKSLDQLQYELTSTKENLQTTIEELEAANEELKSTNEELQSTNEELQSANEELETSKEELQSLNEEAITVNSELQNRISDYQIANDDLKNLFDSTQIAMIFLNTKLCIRRFTPKATQIIPLVDADIGRPIADLNCALQHINLNEMARQVLKTLVKHESKTYDEQGRCFLMRILPYRTARNVIDGVVLSFEDISARNNIELALLNSEKRYKNLFDYSPMPIWEEDWTALESALQQLRVQGITDLDGYLAKHPDEVLQLSNAKRVLAINYAALSLFSAFDKDEFMAKLPQLLVRCSVDPFIQQLLAVWNQQTKVKLELNCHDLLGKQMTLVLNWTIPSDLGRLNFANVIATVLAQKTGEVK